MPIRLMKSGVALGLVASAVFTIWVLVRLGGFQYYTTPLAVRGYGAMHRALRPSGPFGQTFGVFGGVLMLVPFLYMLRKRLVRWKWTGTMKTWLEVHLFCGILGPVLITFHTSFKFNGIISAAYWAMVVVVLSGFIGRYLYVRIPRTIRGTEVSRAELDAHADELLAGLVQTAGSSPWLERVRALTDPTQLTGSIGGLLFGEIGLRLKLRALAREIRTSDLSYAQQDRLMQLTTERALLVRRIAYLQKTKAGFGLWHVFHVPLVYFLLLIACVHVGITLYLGYVPFRW
ncbi:MAG: hypothetical protein ABI634_19310 [Acidobacteriota bacterium]